METKGSGKGTRRYRGPELSRGVACGQGKGAPSLPPAEQLQTGLGRPSRLELGEDTDRGVS